MRDLRLRTIVSAPFDENSYVIGLGDRPNVLVIDPGFQPDLILDYLQEEGLTVAAILNTHGHVDHIAGNAALKRAFPDAPILIGAGDAPMLTDANLNFSGQFGLPVVSPPADRAGARGLSASRHAEHCAWRRRVVPWQRWPHRPPWWQFRAAQGRHRVETLAAARRHRGLPRPRPDNHDW